VSALTAPAVELVVPAGAAFPALGTTAQVLVTDGREIGVATELLRTSLAQIDKACSRFRDDSEISALHRAAGREMTVSPLLAQALAVSFRAALLTDGLVDPTVGNALCRLGYDRDFAEVVRRPAAPTGTAGAAPGWWRVSLRERDCSVLLPRGVSLDLGSTAKAFAADRAAADIARTLACGVLVNLGGDIAVAGDPPQGGWLVRVCEEHDAPQDAPGPLMSITSGGVATSSIVRRTWRQGDRDVHHIVDPRTGDLPEPVWRTVTVAAATCVDANTASTAAVVLAGTAQAWLEQRGLPARLVGIDGDVTTVAGWPPDSQGELG
jgi:thiamine biosynthesis lipoprotein